MFIYLLRNAANIPRSFSGLMIRKMCSDSHIPTKAAKVADCNDNKARERLIWIDCEMTGLDVQTCHLLEIACIITDDQLNIIAKGPNIVIHQPDLVLDSMGEWCHQHHGQSGLTQKSRESRTSVSEAESELLQFVKRHTPPSSCPLAGNSVHVDKLFLARYMPQFVQHLHYRIVDVSTVKELCRRWYPTEYSLAPTKLGAHRALEDIEESINELKYYRKVIFKSCK